MGCLGVALAVAVVVIVLPATSAQALPASGSQAPGAARAVSRAGNLGTYASSCRSSARVCHPLVESHMQLLLWAHYTSRSNLDSFSMQQAI